MKTQKFKIDIAGMQRTIKAQFIGLDMKDPPSWPSLPRYIICVVVTIAVVIVLWFVWLNSYDAELMAERATEATLREDFTKKAGKAANLEALKRQREQVQQYVTQIEKQLPGKSEMDALLSDINTAGQGRRLQFDLFKPGQVVLKEYYAELPISVRLIGRYHELGAFAADIANLSRIVTLNNLSLAPAKDGTLIMEATAKTYRYLDPGEVALQRNATTGAKGSEK